MQQHFVMPVGVDNFRRVREEYYYVDKTDFIRQLIDGHAAATLITRPRRFGKTLTMSMLYYFFSNRYSQRGDLFEGLEIWKDGKLRALQGTYPVIFMTFAGVKGKTKTPWKESPYLSR